MRVRLLDTELDAVTLDMAIQQVLELVHGGHGGLVVTLNVDQAVLLQRETGLRNAYAAADRRYADGMPVVWLSRLLRRRLPERVAGSDLVPGVLSEASEAGLSVHLVGGTQTAAEQARLAVMERYPGVVWTGQETPERGFERDADLDREVARRVAAANPQIVLICLGAPKQEEWALRHRAAVPSAVFLCVGATVDFLGGSLRRAPRWMQRAGLEWVYRLFQEPGRLWYRYLVQDLAFLRLAYGEVWRGFRPSTAVDRVTHQNGGSA